MIDFPITELLDAEMSLLWLERQFHPEGLRCPHCSSQERRVARTNKHYPSYRCLKCDRYYCLFSRTVFEKTRQSPSALVLLLRGIAQGASTSRLSRELSMSYKQTLTLRQRINANLQQRLPGTILKTEQEVELDELYQNAGEKRDPTPRRRRPAATPGKQASRARNV